MLFGVSPLNQTVESPAFIDERKSAMTDSFSDVAFFEAVKVDLSGVEMLRSKTGLNLLLFKKHSTLKLSLPFVFNARKISTAICSHLNDSRMLTESDLFSLRI